MQLKEIEALMREKPYLLNMGAGKLAKGFKVTQDVIKLAKSNVRFGAVKFDNNEKQKNLSCVHYIEKRGNVPEKRSPMGVL